MMFHGILMYSAICQTVSLFDHFDSCWLTPRQLRPASCEDKDMRSFLCFLMFLALVMFGNPLSTATASQNAASAGVGGADEG